MAKATKKQALGRGLSALLKDPSNDINTAQDKNADKIVGNVIDLPLEDIEMNPFQPRTSFNEEHLRELASSIKELGVIQPITVRKKGFGKFELVSGERRCRASKLLGMKTIPAYVRIANDQESLEMALVENIQRQDLDPIEIALSYQRLIEEIDLTQEQMSERVGKSRSAIANYLRLLKLDPIIQTGMRDNFISMGHGRALITIESLEEQLDIYQKILSDNLSVRETEALVKDSKESSLSRKRTTKKSLPEYVESSIENLQETLGTKVTATANSKGKGKLSIAFNSKEELERITKLING
ncbi:ParB/RepB/Spo0J family partition protein [Nonlabens marinus]|uniref:Chromosome (Plasmid) partitioning protein ParB / Stage 0 sporulation protein J n=1 Tax=Nonlabens marinus S1-08 TaxID=1454201 RepID=W8VWK4_9FLAO|nr:ParB/RepB/Spo0J family partition protein [Nonlabens marinus]BAO56418.1 chromosome (plasmid) partitioning protein ParB / Stage 0 sporulation protein J [Nonlabens marinus S1-08]